MAKLLGDIGMTPLATLANSPLPISPCIYKHHHFSLVCSSIQDGIVSSRQVIDQTCVEVTAIGPDQLCAIRNETDIVLNGRGFDIKLKRNQAKCRFKVGSQYIGKTLKSYQLRKKEFLRKSPKPFILLIYVYTFEPL